MATPGTAGGPPRQDGGTGYHTDRGQGEVDYATVKDLEGKAAADKAWKGLSKDEKMTERECWDRNLRDRD